MSMIKVDGGKGLDRANKILAGVPGGIWKAVHGALKRAGETAKTRAGQFAAEEYTIDKGDFMRNVRTKTFITSELGGVVSMKILYAGNVLPLLTFNTKFSRSGLLQTQVKRGNAPAILEHAFAERVFGPIGVYERLGASRFPVEGKYGPSTAHMMADEEVIEKMTETVQQTFDQRIEHEINRILSGFGGR